MLARSEIDEKVEEKQENMEQQNDVQNTENLDVIESINVSNAEANEGETISESKIIPFLDYDALSMEDLVAELNNLVTNHKIVAIKEHVELLKKAFLNKY